MRRASATHGREMGTSACPNGPVSAAFSEQMTKMRAVRGVSLRQLSARMDAHGWPMALATLQKVESGFRRITLDDAVAIAKVLEMKLPAGMADLFSPCGTCNGAPPAGFSCKACGLES